MVGVIFKSIFDTFLMQTELKFFFVSTGNSHNYSQLGVSRFPKTIFSQSFL
jgi:hypothetical protein